jgi:hypothetical protein
LIHHYGGNPLALKLVAAAIQDLFNGSITEVLPDLSQGLAVFEDIRDLLDRQFDRLSEANRKPCSGLQFIGSQSRSQIFEKMWLILLLSNVCLIWSTRCFGDR